MPLLEHLDELRRRLLRAAIGVVLAFGACYWKADELFDWFAAPYRAVTSDPLAVFTISEAFFLKIRVAFVASLFLSAPWSLAQAWGFVSPGLHAKERRLAGPFIVLTSAFFVGGGAFGYFVGMPAILRFLVAQESASFLRAIQAQSYIGTFTHVLIGMGAVFEAPVLAFFLARLGLLRARSLVQWSRHAVVAIAVLAAVITPSGDIPTMVVFAIPMLVLYMLSVGVTWLAQPRVVEEEVALDGSRAATPGDAEGES